MSYAQIIATKTTSPTAINLFIQNPLLRDHVAMNPQLTVEQVKKLWRTPPDLGSACLTIMTHPNKQVVETIVQLDKRRDVMVAAVSRFGLTPNFLKIIQTTNLKNSVSLETFLVTKHLNQIPVTLTDYWFRRPRRSPLVQHVWYYQRNGSTISAAETLPVVESFTKRPKRIQNLFIKHLNVAVNNDTVLLEMLAAKQLYLATLAGVSCLDTNPIVVDAILGSQTAIENLVAKYSFKPPVSIFNFQTVKELMFNPFIPSDTFQKINKLAARSAPDVRVKLGAQLAKARKQKKKPVDDLIVSRVYLKTRPYEMLRLLSNLNSVSHATFTIMSYSLMYRSNIVTSPDEIEKRLAELLISRSTNLKTDTQMNYYLTYLNNSINNPPFKLLSFEDSMHLTPTLHTQMVHLSLENQITFLDEKWLELTRLLNEDPDLWELLPTVADTLPVSVSQTVGRCDCGDDIHPMSLHVLLERAKLLLN